MKKVKHMKQKLSKIWTNYRWYSKLGLINKNKM